MYVSPSIFPSTGLLNDELIGGMPYSDTVCHLIEDKID